MRYVLAKDVFPLPLGPATISITLLATREGGLRASSLMSKILGLFFLELCLIATSGLEAYVVRAIDCAMPANPVRCAYRSPPVSICQPGLQYT